MSQRHATDVVSLVFGIILAGSAVVWLVDLDGHLDRHNSWWVGPLVLLAAGVAGLVASLRPDRHGDGDPRDSQGPSGLDSTSPEPATNDPARLEDEPAS